jgi:hypothetical protein
VDADLERVLKGFEVAREFARTYRFEMTDEYRALIARVEAMPRNQPGADKRGRWLGSHRRWRELREFVSGRFVRG